MLCKLRQQLGNILQKLLSAKEKRIIRKTFYKTFLIWFQKSVSITLKKII